ncbi:TetR/AcrR family transcriptional regulator [Rhizohabitans arisaemae]|uniref:TetR/AcrR family transcriptional regulator n=1 Tax=Rhizohabitans arisaemae TaxID=2720610 RepID=UPI0024B104C5|nr:TetR/AcrR family transcriptional regulator [Rhizohabitans arisaemae]
MNVGTFHLRPESDAARGDVAGLRADALHNRNRIVEAARELFAERGLDVPTALIARRAGVAVATLYRRFPTKDSLVAEVFADRLAACVQAVDDGLADPDPWRGFCGVIEKVCAVQAVDRGFRAVVQSFPHMIDSGIRDRALAGLAELIRRAKACGRLRTDFTEADFTLLLMANGGMAAEFADAAPSASRRLVAYLLDAFRADRVELAVPLPPPAPLNLHDLYPRPMRAVGAAPVR